MWWPDGPHSVPPACLHLSTNEGGARWVQVLQVGYRAPLLGHTAGGWHRNPISMQFESWGHVEKLPRRLVTTRKILRRRAQPAGQPHDGPARCLLQGRLGRPWHRGAHNKGTHQTHPELEHSPIGMAHLKQCLRACACLIEVCTTLINGPCIQHCCSHENTLRCSLLVPMQT